MIQKKNLAKSSLTVFQENAKLIVYIVKRRIKMPGHYGKPMKKKKKTKKMKKKK